MSFASHLRARAQADGDDILFVDTGDRIEGNGLYDASSPKGYYTPSIVATQHLDIITVGNHELYKTSSIDREYNEMIPRFADNYIASNLDYVGPTTGERNPFAPRFRKLTTPQHGFRVLSFGFLFDFVRNANHSVVQPVEETVKEKWFLNAIADPEVDVFVIAGHVAIRDSPEITAVIAAIRAVQPHVPIQVIGGHSHIRDAVKYDERAYGIESGRYMETIGWSSMSGIAKTKATSDFKWQRRYIDNNLFSMHQHTATDESSFPTTDGLATSKLIANARKALQLDKVFGCVPHDYWLDRAPPNSNNSILHWLSEHVLPDRARVLAAPSRRPQIVVSNSGAIRFDMFRGPFTVDTTYLISPFTSQFKQIRHMPYAAAVQLVKLLNNEGPIMLEDLVEIFKRSTTSTKARRSKDMPRLKAPSRISNANLSNAQDVQSTAQQPILAGEHDGSPSLTFGYTTIDDLGNDGDDTIHKRIRYYDVPNVITALVDVDIVHPPETVDFVFNAFIQPWVLLGSRYLGLKYHEKDVSSALSGQSLTQLIGDWVSEWWPCD